MNTNKPYKVYIIQSDCGRLYIGLSEDIVERLREHNTGMSKWTSKYKNWKIIYTKDFPNLSEARKWENYLKRQKGGKGLKKILESSGP
jgi:putative endonuclease